MLNHETYTKSNNRKSNLKVVKVEKGHYRTEDGKYEIKKERANYFGDTWFLYENEIEIHSATSLQECKAEIEDYEC